MASKVVTAICVVCGCETPYIQQGSRNGIKACPKHLKLAYKTKLRRDLANATALACAEGAPRTVTATHITAACRNVKCRRRFTRRHGESPYCDRPECRRLTGVAEDFGKIAKTGPMEQPENFPSAFGT